MTFKAASLLACLLVACSSAAFAQQSGSQEEQQACESDVNTLCGQFIPDRDRIIKCLNDMQCQLSPACHKVIQHYNPKLPRCRVKRNVR